MTRSMRGMSKIHFPANYPPSIRESTDRLIQIHARISLSYDFALVDGAASLFRWSADGKYLARKGKDLISIYELPSMRLLDKKSLKVRLHVS